MDTAIVSVVCIALIVFGGMTMSRGFITSVDSTAQALENMGQRSEKIMRTELTSQGTSVTAANKVRATLLNNGQTKVTDFSRWDVIIQYYGTGGNKYVRWLPWVSGTPGDNQWGVLGIYLNGGAEVFEPDILNPGESITIEVRVNPNIAPNTSGLITVSTPNGVPASVFFTR